MNKIREVFEKIHALDITAFKDDQYFTEDFREQIEEAYCEVMGKIIQERNDLTPAASNDVSIQQHDHSVRVNDVGPGNHLPKIPLPKFSGNPKEWISFKNLFTDMVINSNNSDAAKLSCLKDSLSDKPYYIVKNLIVSDVGFARQIWHKLLDRYDNDHSTSALC